MTAASEEVIRALSTVAPEVLGKKKWRRLLFAIHRELTAKVGENTIGPIAGARREAAQMFEDAMRRCLLEKMQRE